MTGMELLEGLSFVDERYIAEADTAKLGRNVPWMKVLSVAACLCILIVGAFALENLGYMSAKEEAAAPAAPMAAAPQAAAPEAAPEEAAPTMAAPPVPEDSVATEVEAGEGKIPADELQHIPYARLRIVSVLEDGSFEAVVEEISDEPTLFEVGMQVTLVIDPGMVPIGGERTDVEYEKTAAEKQLREIENGAYDPGTGILYVEGLLPSE